MTTVKFEIISDKSGLFNVDSLSYVDQRLNGYITQDQYSSIISKINERMKKFKSPTNYPCLIGLVLIVVVAIKCFVLQITLGSNGDDYSFLVGGLVFIFIIGVMTICCGTCNKYGGEKKEKRFIKLQLDIQKIADEEFMTVYQIAYSKWTIETIGNRETGKKFKLTAEFRLPYPGAVVARFVRSPREPVDCSSIQLDPPPRISEQVTTSLNEQHSQYVIPPATPPPPNYHKVVYLFSQGAFTDCPICGTQKGVFDAKYCTQCGYSFLI